MSQSLKKVVLAYSGGLDTSIIVPWLKEKYGCEVVCMCANLGQAEELTGLEEKAYASGASDCFVEDLRETFVRDFCFPMLRSGAVYEQDYLLGTAIARPLIALRQVEIAHEVGADAVCHGATGKGNDQVRFELSYQALEPDLHIVAPWREWDIRSRGDALAFANKHGVPVTAKKDSMYSRDRNIWHLSHEGEELEDPANAAGPGTYMLSRHPKDAPDEPTQVTIQFKLGVPVAINGTPMDPVLILETLNTVGGEHGVGRVDLLENRLVGIKSRGIYETPGGSILYTAHRALEQLCLDRGTMRLKEKLALDYAELIYNGQWFTPAREALDAFFDHTQQTVSGEATLELYKGSIQVITRESPYSLFDAQMATFEDDEVYNQSDAAGFIRLYGLPMNIRAKKKRSWT